MRHPRPQLIRVTITYPQQLASSYYGPADAKRFAQVYMAGGSGTEPVFPQARLGDSRVASGSGGWSPTVRRGQQKRKLILVQVQELTNRLLGGRGGNQPR